MLGNFKTALSRNAFGNMAYQTLEQGRQPIAAAVDRATSKVTGKHSALGWNKEKAGSYFSGLKKGASEQLKDIAKGIDTGRSGAKGWEQALANNATSFNDTKALGKFANRVSYYVTNAMELGDRPFFEANYKQAYTELEQMLDRYGKNGVAGLEGIKD
jgi:type IV secretory pathway TrbL component